MTFVYIIIATGAIATISMVGLTILAVRKKHMRGWLMAMVALSAGAMLGNAFLHLLPEAIELSKDGPIDVFTIMLLVVGAFVVSFLFEQFFSWHHCHGADHCEVEHKPYANLVIYSDALHNFIDGLIIAAAFMVSPALGLSTAIAIALHEIPQELGDYAVLLHAGWGKVKAAVYNSIAASTIVLGGVAGFFLSSSTDLAVPVLLPIAAGGFLYIAAADLLPELKHQKNSALIPLYILVFLTGLAIMVATAMFSQATW